MRLTLTICAMLMAAAVPVKACEDVPGVQASFVEPAMIAALAADQPAAAIDLSAATDKKPAKKVAKKKKEKVEYMRSAS